MSCKFVALFVTLVVVAPASGLAKVADDQIAEAVLPLPESLKAGATVIAYGEGSERSVLREGSNDWICQPDGPAAGFRIVCYHRSLDAYFHRSRELATQGKAGVERRPILAEEVKSGKLEMPDYALVFGLQGESRENALPLSIVWTAFATEESTGLPTEPDAYRPWLMNAGTAGAHIMFPGK